MRTALAFVCVVATACGAPDVSPTAWAVPLTTLSPHPEDVASVAAGLASQDRVAIAWGAYDAGQLGVAASADELVGLLDDGPMMREVALDAIARLGVTIDAAKLTAIHDAAVAARNDGLAMTAMAVALRDPARHRALVAAELDVILAGLDDDDWALDRRLTRWRAYANALTSLRDTQLVATLVGMLETGIEVEVVSPGLSILRGSCRCSGAFSTHCRGVSYSGSRLPPRGVWRIDAADEPECVVLLPGPNDVCLARIEVGTVVDAEEDAIADDDEADDENDTAIVAVEADAPEDEPIDAARREACEPHDDDTTEDSLTVTPSARNDELLGYLSLLSGEELHFDGTLKALHVWRGAPRYRSALQGMQERIREEHARIVDALGQAYLLPDGYRAPRLAITASVEDDRYCGATEAVPRR